MAAKKRKTSASKRLDQSRHSRQTPVTTAQIPATSLLNQACLLHQQGNVTAAEPLYRQALAADGSLENGWRNLGVLLRRKGDLENSCACTEQAVRLNPKDPSLLGNYGNILRDLKRLPQSQQVLERALQLDPKNAGLRQSLAITCNHARRYDQARQLLEPLISSGVGVESTHWLELGNAFHGLGEQQKAIHCWQKGAETGSGETKLFQQLNIAQSLCEQRQFGAARQLLQPLLPEFEQQANLHYALGVIARGEEQLSVADREFQRALELEPDYPLCLNTYGLMLRDLGRINAARNCFEQALHYQSSFAEAMNNLGSVLKDVGQLQQGLHWLRRSAELLPDNPVIQSNVLFTLCGYNMETPAQRLEEAQRFSERFATAPFERWKDRLLDPSPNRRLRVGLISPDFCRHAVSYFIEPLLERWDRSQLEIVAYHCGEHQDDYTKRLQVKVDQWRSVERMGLEDLIQQVLRDEIDILLDLAGHTAGNRLQLLAHKPAPIQATYLGYYASTGLKQVDYWVTDSVIHPDDNEDLAAEMQWRLNRCYVCYRPTEYAPLVHEPPVLSRGFPTFGSFNQSRKITKQTAEHWMTVLRAFPDSQLLLKSKNLGEPEERQRVQELFANLGLAPERLHLRGHSLHLADHMAGYHELDIALDTYPYTGCTTTADALWMGVPVLTIPGESMVTRQAASLLAALGEHDWICSDAQAMVEQAKGLLADISSLRTRRLTQRERMTASPILDYDSLARCFEDSFRQWWHRWLEQNDWMHEMQTTPRWRESAQSRTPASQPLSQSPVRPLALFQNPIAAEQRHQLLQQGFHMVALSALSPTGAAIALQKRHLKGEKLLAEWTGEDLTDQLVRWRAIYPQLAWELH